MGTSGDEHTERASMKIMHCHGCGKEIKESEAYVRGENLKNVEPSKREFAKCSDCDYRDYSNTYGGM